MTPLTLIKSTASTLILNLVLTLFILPSISEAQTIWTIVTPQDRFEVIEDLNGLRIGDKAVNPGTFDEFRSFIDTENPTSNCPSLTLKPDVEVKKVISGNLERSVQIFLGEKLLRINDTCSQLKGEGIFSFPMTRAWYVGANQMSIATGSLNEFRFGSDIIKYRLKDGDYILSSGAFFPDWEKIRKFESALKSFAVEGRRRLEYGKDKPFFDYNSGGKNFRFYEVAPRVWAVKFPDVNWLVLSKNFQWGAFSLQDLKLPFSDALLTFRNSKAEEKDRLNALANLTKTWNESLQKAYIAVLLDEKESNFLRKQTAEALIQKPVLKNKQALVKALLSTQSDELQEFISRRMKLYFPKGEVLTPRDDTTQRNKKLATWRSWIQSQKE